MRQAILTLMPGLEVLLGRVRILRNPPVKRTKRSADRSNRKLLADLSRQAIVDLGVTGNRSFCAVCRIKIYRVATPFAIQPAPLVLQVTNQFMPLQAQRAPT